MTSIFVTSALALFCVPGRTQELGSQPIQRSVEVNGVLYGVAWTKGTSAPKEIFIEEVVANESGLQCFGDGVELGTSKSSIRMCRILVDEYSYDRNGQPGGRLTIRASRESFARSKVEGSSSAEAIAEEQMTSLAFLNYGLFGSELGDSRFMQGQFHLGIRHFDDAFDLEAASRLSGRNFTSGDGGITTFSYRREWREENLVLSVGRLIPSHQVGRLSTDTLEGFSLTKSNIDPQGNLRSSRGKPLSGFLPAGGVLQYRRGNQILREIPISPGQFEVDPSALFGLPSGGIAEVYSSSGELIVSDANFLASRSVSLYELGTYDWQVTAGSYRSRGSATRNVGVGGSLRVGISPTLTLGVGGTARENELATSVEATMSLPLGLGDVASSYEQRSSVEPDSRQWTNSSSWAIYYGSNLWENYRIFSASYIKDTATHWESVAETRWNEIASVSLGVPLFQSRLMSTIRVSGERVDSAGAAWARRLSVGFAGVLGPNLNWSLEGRVGRDANSRRDDGVSLALSMPIGNRTTGMASVTRQRFDGVQEESRGQYTVSGTRNFAPGGELSYSVGGDTAGGASGYFALDTQRFVASGSLYSAPTGQTSGYFALSGGLVGWDGRVFISAPVRDSLVIVDAPDNLSAVTVARDSTGQPLGNLDEKGDFVVARGLTPYKSNRLLLLDDDVPIGMEVDTKLLRGTVLPFRAYIKKVAVRQIQSARLFLNIPADARLASDRMLVAGHYTAPLESDDSVYIEDIESLRGISLEVLWSVSGRNGRCTVVLPAGLEESFVGNESLSFEARNVECKA